MLLLLRLARPRDRRALSFLLGVVALVPLASGALQEREPELATEFEAKLKKVEELAKGAGASLVTIEVENVGAFEAEPLSFRVEPLDAAPLVVHRVLPPAFGRAGRTVEPGRRERFVLAVPMPEDALKKASVHVVDASVWPEGVPGGDLKLSARSVKVGKPEAQGETANRRTSVELTNRTDLPLDVILEGTFRNDGGGQCLLAVHLRPNESRVEVVNAIPAVLDGSQAAFQRADLKRLKVIDWSAHIDGGGGVAADLLRRAWDAWERVPAARLPLSANFVADVDHRGLFGAEGRFDLVERLEGRFTIDGDGQLEVTDREGQPLGPGAGSIALRGLKDALRWVTRPDYDAIASDWEVRLRSAGEPAIVRVSGAEDFFRRSVVDVELRDDSIVAVAGAGGLKERAERWDRELDAEGWRLLARVLDTPSQGEFSKRATYTEVEGLQLLEEWVDFQEGLLIEAPQRLTLSFADWSFNEAAPELPAAPTGPLADRLRAAWDGFYRYPEPRVELRGRYSVEIKGGDGIWLGRTGVTGSFSLRHFDGAYWKHRELTCDDRKATSDERVILINAVEDRIGMWSGRVPTWRPRFAEQFAGASLAPGEGADWVRVEDHPRLAGVRIVDGRVRAVRFSGGRLTRYEWRELDEGVLLPIRVEREGNGNVDLRWKEVAPGWWFPERAHFTEIFGADWGPETLEFETEAPEPLDG